LRDPALLKRKLGLTKKPPSWLNKVMPLRGEYLQRFPPRQRAYHPHAAAVFSATAQNDPRWDSSVPVCAHPGLDRINNYATFLFTNWILP
jgi:hypothetical protein